MCINFKNFELLSAEKHRMPYHFESFDENYQIFTGIDAKENDLLARWGWEEDILFHIAGLPGGHIYLRTPNIINKKAFKQIKKLSDFELLLNIPSNVITQCLQLAKQYSSRGKKEKNASIHITPWLNVKKHDGDNYGTVEFQHYALVKTLRVNTNQDMIDMLQESRSKQKMTEDDFRKQRDQKYLRFNTCIIANHWKRRNMDMHFINVNVHRFKFRCHGQLKCNILNGYLSLYQYQIRMRPAMINAILRSVCCCNDIRILQKIPIVIYRIFDGNHMKR